VTRRCYMCKHWQSTQAWKGNCRLHPWDKDRYNQDAMVSGCADYEDRAQQYAGAVRKEK
jgi:hypothetical protein